MTAVLFVKQMLKVAFSSKNTLGQREKHVLRQEKLNQNYLHGQIQQEVNMLQYVTIWENKPFNKQNLFCFYFRSLFWYRCVSILAPKGPQLQR